MYLVHGGVYTDTNFDELEEGTNESYGPFYAYNEALTAWRRHTFTQSLDNCYHRLKIIWQPTPHGIFGSNLNTT